MSKNFIDLEAEDSNDNGSSVYYSTTTEDDLFIDNEPFMDSPGLYRRQEQQYNSDIFYEEPEIPHNSLGSGTTMSDSLPTARNELATHDAPTIHDRDTEDVDEEPHTFLSPPLLHVRAPDYNTHGESIAQRSIAHNTQFQLRHGDPIGRSGTLLLEPVDTNSSPANDMGRDREENPGAATTQLDDITGAVGMEREIHLDERGRWKLTNMFLTYAHNDTPLETVRDNFIRRFREQIHLLIARELHADGTPHIHVVCLLGSQWNITRADLLPLAPGGEAVNILKITAGKKSIHRVVKYVAKHNDYLQYPPEHFSNLIRSPIESDGKWNNIASEVLKGTPLDYLLESEDYRGLMAQNLRKVQAYSAAVTMSNKRKRTSTLPHDFWLPTQNPEIQSLMDWTTKYFVNKETFTRGNCLWIWGAPLTGKTALLTALGDYLEPYIWPKRDNGFHCNFDNGLYDFILIDEYNTARIDIDELNEWTSEGRVYVRRKTIGGTQRGKLLPLIVCSNVHPTEIYTVQNENIRDAFLSRWIILNFAAPGIIKNHIRKYNTLI